MTGYLRQKVLFDKDAPWRKCGGEADLDKSNRASSTPSIETSFSPASALPRQPGILPVQARDKVPACHNPTRTLPKLALAQFSYWELR